MPQPIGARRFLLALAALSAFAATAFLTQARAQDDAYHPNDTYSAPGDDDDAGGASPPYRPSGVYREDDNYRRYDDGGRTAAPAPNTPDDSVGYGEPYHAPDAYDDRPYDGPPPDNGYSQNEILEAGRSFFGSVTKGLASVVEYSFRKSGRPNGYILGEDAGGAFIAGLRYGEGTLYTKDAGVHKVYWQGPSIGYDFGGEGSKTMVLVYNLRDPWQIYHRYAGVQGSAYFVGGVGIQYQTYGNVTLAPIRAGVGLRLGANVGYLKYTRSPTWNPF